MTKLPPEVRAFLSKNGKKGGKNASETNAKDPNFYKKLSKHGLLARWGKKKKTVDNSLTTKTDTVQ